MRKLMIVSLLALMCFVSQSFAQEKNGLERRIQRLKAELNLSDEQVEQVKQVYIERAEELRAIQMEEKESDDVNGKEKRQARTGNENQRRQLNKKMKEKLAGILNEDQMEKYEALQAKRRNGVRETRELNTGYDHNGGIQYDQDDQ